MLLEHIIMFYKIATEKSISKVAQNNHISQPALSQQMQRLEEEFGVQLFIRTKNSIALTEAGKMAASDAEMLQKGLHRRTPAG